MSAPKSVSGLIAELLRTRPEVDAPAPDRAEWFLNKADVLDAIADEDGPNAGEARALAGQARRDAADIQSGGVR